MVNTKIMTIAIASPISTGAFSEFLNEESKVRCEELSKNYAPAVTTLAKEFISAGHKLIIFTLDPKATDELTLIGESVTIYVAPAVLTNRLKRGLSPFIGRDVRMINKLFNRNREPIDVISVHWTRDYAIAARRFIKQIPVFVTVRDIIPYILSTQKLTLRNYRWWIIYLMNEYVMLHKDYKFIANSQYTANSIKRYWNKDVPVISNPTLDKYFKIKYSPANPDKVFEISTISISHPDDKRKNILSLLKAFQIVHKKFSNTRLNLIGPSFSEENPVVKQLSMTGLLNGVKLRGAMAHDEVLKFLSQSHLMVHPSLEETFGNTLIESMAVGCPVVGGIHSGAVPFVLENGKAGYLCNVESAETLAETIIKVIESPEDRERISQYAKGYCNKNYSSKNIAQQYLQLFKDAIQSMK